MRKRSFRPALCTCLTLIALRVSSLTGCTSWVSEQETSGITSPGAAMQLNKASSGALPDGQEATLYTLTNRKGVSVTITNYGVIVTSVVTPDKNGEMGFDGVSGYVPNVPCIGATIGRCANRHAMLPATPPA